MNTTRTHVPKRLTHRALLEELLSATIRKNYDERIKTLEGQVDLWKGNHDELLKRVKAMEGYLKVEYVLESKYKKK